MSVSLVDVNSSVVGTNGGTTVSPSPDAATNANDLLVVQFGIRRTSGGYTSLVSVETYLSGGKVGDATLLGTEETGDAADDDFRFWTYYWAGASVDSFLITWGASGTRSLGNLWHFRDSLALGWEVAAAEELSGTDPSGTGTLSAATGNPADFPADPKGGCVAVAGGYAWSVGGSTDAFSAVNWTGWTDSAVETFATLGASTHPAQRIARGAAYLIDNNGGVAIPAASADFVRAGSTDDGKAFVYYGGVFRALGQTPVEPGAGHLYEKRQATAQDLPFYLDTGLLRRL